MLCGEERVGGKSCGLWANVQKDRRKSWRLEIGDWVLEPAGQETASGISRFMRFTAGSKTQR